MATVLLGLGSNLDRERNIQAAVYALSQAFPGAQFSSIYESPARGFAGPPFLNLAARIETGLSVADLMAWIRDLECRQGRQDTVKKMASRTLDIDLLCYGQQVGTVDGVRLPREEIRHNAHVLVPLAELEPQGVDPETGRHFAEMAQQPQILSQPLRRVSSVRA